MSEKLTCPRCGKRLVVECVMEGDIGGYSLVHANKAEDCGTWFPIVKIPEKAAEVLHGCMESD